MTRDVHFYNILETVVRVLARSESVSIATSNC